MGRYAKFFGSRRKFYTILTGTSVLSLALWIILQFGVDTPRARLNVVVGVAVLFFGAVLKAAVAGAASEESAIFEELRWRFWPAIGLAAATWACVIPCYFTSDDFSLLHQAQRLTSGSVWAFVARSQATTFFRPLGQLSLLLDYHLWHLWPAGYHLTNIALHLISVVGVYSLVRQFRLSTTAAAACALIFGVLPIQIEAVAWMICRFDLLATCLTIWAVVLYSRYRNSGRQINFWAALILFVLAMLSKESGYIAPLLIGAAELFVFPKARLKPLSGFIAAGGFVFVLRWIHLGGIGGYVSSSGMRQAFVLHFKTLEALFLRGPSQAIWGINWQQPGSVWFTAVCSTLIAALLMLAFCTRLASSGRAAIRFGLCWMLASMLPVHSLILIGSGLTNARLLYMCSVGAAIVVGTLLAGIKGQTLRLILTGAIAILFSQIAVHNSKAWRWATELSRIFPEQLKQLEPAPSQNAEFLFRNMPETLRGVYFYAVGLQDSIQMAYGREDLTAFREGQVDQRPHSPEANRSIISFEWHGNPSMLVRRSVPPLENRYIK